jgi:hypothetical protein
MRYFAKLRKSLQVRDMVERYVELPDAALKYPYEMWSKYLTGS